MWCRGFAGWVEDRGGEAKEGEVSGGAEDGRGVVGRDIVVGEEG